jgi:PAS domain S-box-containing protein
MDTAAPGHPDAQEIALLRKLAKVARVGAWEYDVQQDRLHFTAEMYELLELEPAAGEPPRIEVFSRFFPAAAQPQVEAAWRAAIKNGQTWDFEVPMVTGRGRQRWMRSFGEAEMRGGRCVRLFGTLQDVTTARLTSDALRTRTNEARKLALVAEHTSDLVIITDAQHRIEWVNASFEQVTGYTAAEAIGKTPRALLNRADSEDGPNFEELRQTLRSGGAVTGAELKLYRKDGTPYWVELEQRPVRDETGAISHYIHIQRDITARREARQRELELARRLRLVTATAGIGTFQRELDTGAGTWDEATFRLFGFAPAAQPPPLADVLARVHPEDRARYRGYVDAVARDGQPHEVEFRVVHPDGHVAWLHERGLLEPGAGGRRIGIGVVFDVTAQRSAERRALAVAEQLALAVEATGIGFYRCSDDTDRLELDPKARALLGLAPQEAWLSRWQFEAMVVVEDRPIAARLRADRVRAEGVVEAALRIVRRDGERRWLRVRCAAAAGTGTDAPRVIGMIADVTAQKQEEASRESERERLALATAAVGIGTWEIDVATGAGRWSDEMRALHGLAADEPVPSHDAWRERFVHPDDRSVIGDVRRLREAREPLTRDFRIVRSDGGVRWLRSRLVHVPAGPTGPERVVGVSIDVTDRKLAQQRADELAALLQLAEQSEAMGVGYALRDLQTGAGQWTAQTRRLLGYGADDPVPTIEEWLQRVLPGDRDKVRALYETPPAPGTSTEIEFALALPGGGVRHILLRAGALYDADGRATRLLCAVIDVTALKRTSLALTAALRRLELATAGSAVGIWERELDREHAYWSPEAFDIWGLPLRDRAPGWSELIELVHPEDRALFEQRWQMLVRSPRFVDTEFRIVRPDGSEAWLLTRGRLDADRAGQPARVVGVVLDITARKRAERQATEMAGWLELATRSMGIGLWYRDLHVSTATWDAQMFRIFGLDPAGGAPSTEGWLAMILPEDRTQFVGVDLHTPPPGSTLAFSYRIRRPDGAIRYLQSRRACLYGTDGRPRRVYGAVIDVTETRTAGEALSEARDRLSLAAEVGGIASWERNLETGEGRWDELLFRFYGLPAASEVPTFSRVLEMVHPEDRATFERNWQRVLESRGTVEMETRVVQPDGTVRVLVTRARADRRADGTPWRVIGATIDATDLRTAQRERDALAERMQLIAESVGVGVWDWNPVARVTLWNDRMFELFGRPREWFADKTWLDAIHPDDRAGAEAALRSALAGGDRFESEFRTVWADGSVHWIASRGRIQRDPSGRVTRAIGVNIDITDRRRAEQAARELLERVRLTASATGIGMWELDLATLEMHWDEQTYRLAGRTPAELGDLRTSWTRVIHPDDLPMMRAAQDRALRDLQPFDLETRIVWPNGEVRYVALRGQLQLDERGRPAKQFGVVFDVTERRLAESALRAKETAERANQAKTEFLSRMSHELRTPLNAILGFTQILELDQQHPLAAAQRDRVRHIKEAGWHLLALIDEILDLSRIESGKAKLALAAVPLAEVIDECVTLVAPDAAKRGIDITVQRSADVPAAAWADRTRLKQVLLNLLSNAVKYNRERGSVRVTLGADADGNALIAVRDTGHGLSARQIDQLFQPFNRLGLESAPIQGTGIGLALSLKLIERMGGRLEVSSELQVGTEFRVTLPAARAGAHERHAAPAPAAGTPRGDVRGGVLYVEDNADNVAIVEQMLALRPQVKLFAAADGATARVLAAVCQPDLILLDMRLPDTDGLTLLRELRAQPETSHIPCVALSASALPEDVAQARQQGFVDYWTKPLDAAQFLRGIDTLLAAR